MTVHTPTKVQNLSQEKVKLFDLTIKWQSLLEVGEVSVKPMPACLRKEERESLYMTTGVNKDGTGFDPNVQDAPEDLRPEQVALGVLYLASPECRESGFILRASNGQFTAARWVERDNVNYPLNLAAVEVFTAEDLATRWREIAADVAF